MRHIYFYATLFFCASAFASSDLPSYKEGQTSDSFFKGKTHSQIAHACANGESTLVTTFCSKRKFEAANRKLESIYKTQLQSIQERDSVLNEEGRSSASKVFISSHESWLRYRDDTCVYEYLYLGSGTIRGAEYFDCLQMMTIDRYKTLSKGLSK